MVQPKGGSIMSQFRKFLLAALALGLVCSFAQAQETEKKITRAQLPPAVEKTVSAGKRGRDDQRLRR